MAGGQDFPSELSDVLRTFHSSLKDVENTLKPLLSQNPSVLAEKLTPLQRAQLDLATVYTLNSLYWMYLRTLGQNPKEHDIKQELERIKNYMARAKTIADREKAPRLDKNASKRFVLHSLWEPKDSGENSSEKDGDQKRTEAQKPLKKKMKLENPS